MGGACNSPYYNRKSIDKHDPRRGMPTHLKVIVIVRLVLHGIAHCPAKTDLYKAPGGESKMITLTGTNEATAIDNGENPFDLKNKQCFS